MSNDSLGLDLGVPTWLTLANLTCGFFALIAATGQGVFGGGAEEACWWIVSAIVFDGLDGLIARWLGLASRFGTQLDSLADMVSAGAAPGMLIAGAQGPPTTLGLGVSCLYVACAALRLARFVTEPPADPRVSGYAGLPSPAAAALVSGAVLAGASGTPLLLISVVVCGLMLVPHKFFPHPAAIGAQGIIAVLIVGALLVILDRRYTVLGAVMVYQVWAIALFVKRR